MIHIDGIVLSLQAHGGISVYFRELLRRLATSEYRTTLSLEPPLKGVVGDLSALALAYRKARLFERYRRCRSLDSGPATLFHSTYYRRPADTRVPTVVTVHDFAYERCVGGFKTKVHATQKYAAIRRAQLIICISEATRDDLMQYVGVRKGQTVQVIHNGVSEAFHPLPSAAPQESPPFVLFVGQRGRYKNFALALAALRHLPDVELHCVGGGPLEAHELAGAPESVCRRVKHLGPVDDFELNRLYNAAQCLLYPSAYEGFGIPVLEAMRAGCPVVCIDCKAVREVGGAALVIAEHPRGDSLAEAISLSRGLARERLRSLGLSRAAAFSWDRCYAQTLAAYRSLGAIEQSELHSLS